jgi:hypothetical protein
MVSEAVPTNVLAAPVLDARGTTRRPVERAPLATRHSWARVAVVAIALAFVVVGVDSLDLGPVEARLGLAAGSGAGPLGQVVGYWAPDLWPAEVLPSFALAHLQVDGRPTSGVVRWPAAVAGIIAGFILIRRLAAVQGRRAAVILALCWFGSIGLIDRSGGAGLDLVLGLALIAAINRALVHGTDVVAGCWAAVAFLAGGWPPLVLIWLAVIVAGKTTAGLNLRLLLPPLLAAGAWSALTTWTCSAEAWAAALALPFTQKPSWLLALSVLALGLPWSPFISLALSRATRSAWTPECRSWVVGWIQVAGASAIAGTLVPGMSAAARVVVLAGLAVGSAVSLDAAWLNSLSQDGRRWYLALCTIVSVQWLSVMTCGSFVWCVALPFYRTLGIVMVFVVLAVAILTWWTLASADCRRALLMLTLIAIGLKLAHWGYYVPEWNYRHSQGPWARAIAQWLPRKWTLYTFHDWPPDLAFFMKRPVRQLRSPHFLQYESGPESKFLLLLPSERDNWPDSALPISVVATFQDAHGAQRVLARTPGALPPPLGPNLLRIGLMARDSASRVARSPTNEAD